MDFKTCRKVWTELLVVYPVKYQKMKYFNSGIFMNILQSLKRRFLPDHITDKIETGCKVYGHQRLGDIYLVPTVEEANLRNMMRFSDALEMRYRNETKFRLLDE